MKIRNASRRAGTEDMDQARHAIHSLGCVHGTLRIRALAIAVEMRMWRRQPREEWNLRAYDRATPHPDLNVE